MMEFKNCMCSDNNENVVLKEVPLVIHQKVSRIEIPYFYIKCILCNRATSRYQEKHRAIYDWNNDRTTYLWNE